MRLAAAIVLAAGLAAGSPTGAASPTFTGLVVLGDSLSDSGNAGRFSNGPVWAEHLAGGLGLALRPASAGGTNYAVGGARAEGGSFGVPAQLAAYLARGVDSGALHVVYAGGNDILAALWVPEGEAAARRAAAAVGRAVAALAEAGAAWILVPNLPDVGLAPAVRGHGAGAAGAARRLTEVFNAELAAALRAVEDRHGLAIWRLDVFALAERVVGDPAAAGFRDVRTPCQGGDCDGALFWDSLHPTTAAHARLGAAALEVLGAAPGRASFSKPR